MSAAADKGGQARQRFPWALLAFALPALIVLLMLGNWQVQRLAWKQDLLATIDARVISAPVTIDQITELAGRGGDIRYMPVTVAGTLAHDREQHFFATHKGASGYYVYTPLELNDGRVVLVNRGFVPFDLKDPATRPQGQVQGEVTITGLARERLDAKPSSIVPDNDLDANIYYWKDWSSMVLQSGYKTDGAVLPFFIDADDTPNPGLWPVGGVTRIDLPNNHLQYAVTWYGLGGALVVVVAVFMWRRVKEKPDQPAGS